jgi:hypothetical protein
MLRSLSLLPRLAFILAALGSAAAADVLVNENLLAGAPPGYKIGFQDKKSELQQTEWVPVGQTVDKWTEMLTVQVFYGLKTTPQQFMRTLEQRWHGACPGAGEAQPIVSGVENGYASLLWILDCPQNPTTGQLELTWFKGIQGNDSFYVVQKAFKFSPNKEQIARWVGYLKAVQVCDSRIADRACPQAKK